MGAKIKNILYSLTLPKLNRLDSNQSAEKEEFEEKMKELEAVCKPIIEKLQGSFLNVSLQRYSITNPFPPPFPPAASGAAPGAGGMPEGGMPDMSGASSGAPPPAQEDEGPKIEEID